MTEFNPLDPAHYAFWQDALNKRKHNVEIRVPVDKPSCGYFKSRRRAGDPYEPVAIWFRKDGTMACKIGRDLVDPLPTWNYCAANPLTEAEYKDGLANGFPAQIGDNQPPPEDLIPVEQATEELLQKAREWVKGLTDKAISTQEQADSGAIIVERLRAQKKAADEHRLSLTKPHRDAEAAINAQWKKPIEALDTACKMILGIVGAFFDQQKAKAAQIEAETGVKTEAPKAGAGTTKRAISTRKDYRVEVLEPEIAAAHYAQHPKILEIVIKLAAEEFKATGKNPPGCSVTEGVKAR